MDLLGGPGQRSQLARVYGELGEALLNGHDPEAAGEVLREGAERFADLQDDPGVVLIESQLSRALMFMNRMAESVEVADRALAAAERGELRELIGDTLVTKGTSLSVIGRPVEGLGLLRAALAMAEERGDLKTASRARANLAGPLAADDPRASFESDREGLLLAARLGMRGNAQISLLNSFFNGRRIGAWDTIRADVAENLTEGLDPVDRATALSASVITALDVGEPAEEMIAEIDRLLAGVTDLQTVGEIADIHAAQAFVAFRFGEAGRIQRDSAGDVGLNAPDALLWAARSALLDRDLEAARGDLRALDETWARGRYMRACKRAIEAGIAALEGRVEDSLVAHREAVRALRDLHVDFEVALTELQMAWLLDPSLPDVAAAVEDARATFTRLGAPPYLAMLDRAVGARVVAPAGAS
jgi:tetratricopeptide (TPR) repeat protein